VRSAGYPTRRRVAREDAMGWARANPLPPFALAVTVALAVAITGQGAYYPTVQAFVALGLLVAAFTAAGAASWSSADLRVAPVPACAALAAWAVISATANGDASRARGLVLLLTGVALLVAICRRATKPQREALIDAVTALAALAALSGWIGVAWHAVPWALGDGDVWRAATTLTYWNAAAGLLVPVALVAMARLATRGASAVGTASTCLLLVGAGATLSRGGAVALLAGWIVLGGLIGFRRLLAACAAPVLGAGIALAGLAPSFPASSPGDPAVAVAALLAGLATAVLLSRLSRPAVLAVCVLGALAGATAVAAGSISIGAVDRVTDTRVTIAGRGRPEEAGAALRAAASRPITGRGPGTQLVWTEPGGETLVARYAHNEYLQVLADLGFVGILVLAWLMASTARVLARGSKWSPSRGVWAGVVAALVAFSVHGLFDFVWHVPAIVLMCAVFVGVVSEPTERTGDRDEPK
jgi:O-antigen ligase